MVMIPDQQSVIDEIVAKIEAEERRAAQAEHDGYRARSPHLRDEMVIEKLTNSPDAGVREDFESLWAGTWEGKYPSQSKADRALCRLIGYYTQDEEQIAWIFERSGIYRPDKWGKRSDYRRRTIGSALSSLPKAYQGLRKGGSKLHHYHSPHKRREDDEASARPSLELKAFASIEDPGPRQFVIERLLPKGYPLLFYGDGGTTKSLLVLSMLQAIARGADAWLGLRVGGPMALKLTSSWTRPSRGGVRSR
jgi:hypothetical protein